MLCNNLSGQYININRLDIYEQKKNHDFDVNKSYEDLTFGHLKHYQSALLTQKLSIQAKMAFLNDYKKHFKKLRIDKSIHVNLHNQFSRVIHTKNEEMQRRIVDQIQTPTNHIKITLGNFLINPAPSNSLVKVEVILMDNRCNLYENHFFTSESNMQHKLICFESEAKALVGKTAFKESKCMKLPALDSSKTLKEYTMFFFIKIA